MDNNFAKGGEERVRAPRSGQELWNRPGDIDVSDLELEVCMWSCASGDRQVLCQ